VIPTNDSILETAIKAVDLGLSVVSPRQDGTRAPVADIEDGVDEKGKTKYTWKPYQTAPATREHVQGWYRGGHRTGVGLACGVKNLECLDFDDEAIYQEFKRAAAELGLDDLVKWIESGYLERSPSGGVHWFYYCNAVRGNTKLACRPKPGGKVDTLIETRGQGGYIIIAPTNGKVHPSGGTYELLAGGLETIRPIGVTERDALWELARSFDEMPPKPAQQHSFKIPVPPGCTEGKRPGDDFADRTSWEEILEAHGWTKVFTRGDVTYWRRPGKDRGWSATTGYCKGLKVFSSSTKFSTQGTYTKFGAYAVLKHEGDFKAAAQALAQAGYGTWIDEQGQEHPNPAPKRSKANGTASQDSQPLLDAYKPKTFGDIASNIGTLKHLWQNWLVIGNLSMIYSKPKHGKTRVYIRWIKTLWYAEQWPDGTPNEWPAGTKTLVIPYDRNHQEIADTMQAMKIPDEAAVCPYDPRDPLGLSLLDISAPLMVAILDKILSEDKAIKLVVVDTLTYASNKSLSKPEDMKEILDQVMRLAAKHGVAALVLIHENREGEALGRRISERARVLMKLERYSDNDPTKLRLYVKESNFKERPALSVTHTDTGIDFTADQGSVTGGATRCYDCARFLVDYLRKKGLNVQVDFGTLIDALGLAGFAGTMNSDNRWSDRKLFSRAVNAINDEVEALKDLWRFKIVRREEPRIRGKPVITYRLDQEMPIV
jgi:hypothetical protein